MKHERTKPLFTLPIALLLLTCALMSAHAQPSTTQSQAAPQNQASNNAPAQAIQPQNLPEALNFTPEQQQQWRQINREFRPQEIAAAAKLRDAQMALNAAMESPTPNEELIKQRAKDLADARSAAIQLQALRQARVLQILTPEQRVKLKEIRQQAQALKREQQTSGNGQGKLLRRNANAPLLTPAQRKALKQQRQQQKPKG
ncbi:MAG TPA: periplasmic heavy metal sensor [Pyrinomonadaceae bacterium]|nr:periplasmic heavy metal sensor [Pyrinomonadaceae bacterium]